MSPALHGKERSFISKQPFLVMKDHHINSQEDKTLDLDQNKEPFNTVHDDPSLTESSSSFDSDGSSFSEPEVNSNLYDNDLAFPFGDLFRMRKKKPTLNWRKYVGPLMWRCKWLELQIKKFESQAQKYDREVAEYSGRKPFKSCISENGNLKSLPFVDDQSQRKAEMKRKKRRRAEDIEDIESYMSHHNLFSYFEDKKSAADAAWSEGNRGNQGAGADKTSYGTNETGFDEELLSCDKDGGNYLEQLFWKIGLMQLQVREMKTRAHNVLSENASRFCSTENLSMLMPMPCNNALTNFAENPSPRNFENKVTAAATFSDASDIVRDDSNIKMVNVKPEAALEHREVNHVPENIETTYSPANGGSSRNPSGAILMYNRRAKTTPSKLKEEDVSTEMPQGPSQDDKSSSLVSYSQDPEPSIPKIRSISEVMSTGTTGTTSNKRKRAMRKAGFGKWSH